VLDDMQNWQSSAGGPRIGEFYAAISLFLLIIVWISFTDVVWDGTSLTRYSWNVFGYSNAVHR